MATILIVDDEPLNRELLIAYLDGADHLLLEAASGETAIRLALEHRPDLVLLDVMMPGLDGYETTARLKSLFEHELLPIILVTARADHESRLQGLRAGADEFLTKPVERHELALRVDNLLALRAKEAALVRRNVELVELQRFREEMSALVVHDLKNPLAVILANLDYVIDGEADGDEWREAWRDSKSAGERALRLLANLADLTRIEVGQLPLVRARTQLDSLIAPLVKQRAHLAEARSIRFDSELATGAPVCIDAELMSRVVENVFDNALRHTPAGGRIAVRGSTQADAVRLCIGNTGNAIPAESRMRIFDKFGQAGAQGRMNLGLGLYFCRLAIEAHGGKIWVEESTELPTIFNLELPRAVE